jgi:hypothetical protein
MARVRKILYAGSGASLPQDLEENEMYGDSVKRGL